jgi:hypothetical protein
MSILQELLQTREQEVLLERVDHMLDGLRTHFSNENNSDPVKVFSSSDLEETAFQLAGLNFILDQKKDIGNKIPEFKDFNMLHKFLNELDEPRERKMFNDRTQTAGEFLTFIGHKYESSTGKSLLKTLSALKKREGIASNSNTIASFVGKLERKLADFMKSVR